jgi:choline dehydrogenase-like flavoprotein
VVVDQVLDDHDHRRLESGRAMALELLDHEAFRNVVDHVSVGTAPAMVYHPTSTCAMGTVVDDDGAVVGYEGLHVADASVFPDIPRANTYLPTLMLAERLATRLARR